MLQQQAPKAVVMVRLHAPRVRAAPMQSGARRRRLEELASCTATLILYCPPHALGAVLADMAEAWGTDRHCSIAR